MLNGFAIIKVCYKDNNVRDSIKSVKAGRFNSKDGKTIDSMGNIVSWSKGQIIGMINDVSEGIRVFTATALDDKYILGQEAEVHIFNEQKYLRTKGSSFMRDDLDEVPVYEAHC